MSDETKHMNWEEFVEKFKPVFNHIEAKRNPSPDPESCCSVNGRMFETNCDQEDFVRTHPENQVWTVLFNDDNEYDTFRDNYTCEDCHAPVEGEEVDEEDREQCCCGKSEAKALKAGLEPYLPIVKGYHWVNRNGYIVTEKPWNDETNDVQY